MKLRLKKNLNEKIGKIYTLLVFFAYHEKLIKKCDVLKNKYVLLVTCCKRFHPKSLIYEKMKMITKKFVVIESFFTIRSFDCDHTYS